MKWLWHKRPPNMGTPKLSDYQVLVLKKAIRQRLRTMDRRRVLNFIRLYYEKPRIRYKLKTYRIRSMFESKIMVFWQ